MLLEDLAKYGPEVVEAVVSLVHAFDRQDTKQMVASQVRLRRSVDAARSRREAAAKAAKASPIDPVVVTKRGK